jgi:hypothetical protein
VNPIILLSVLLVSSTATRALANDNHDTGTVDVRNYGAATNRPDNSRAIARAMAVAKAQQKRLHLPPGTWKISKPLLFDWDNGGIVGDGASLNLTGSVLVMTATNVPVVQFSNCYNGILNSVAITYTKMQDATETNSKCIELLAGGHGVVKLNVDKVCLRRGAYGYFGGTEPAANWNQSIGDLWIGSWSRSAIAGTFGTGTTFDNVYVQNNFDSQVCSSVSITNILLADHTNLTFYCASLPVYLYTNAIIGISGADPEINDYYVCAGIHGNQVTADAACWLNPLVRKQGTLSVTYQPSVEPPINLCGWGFIAFHFLDVESALLLGTNPLIYEDCNGLTIEHLHTEWIHAWTNDIKMVRNNGLSTWIGTADFYNTGIPQGHSLDLLCNMGFHGTISCDIARITDATTNGAAIVPILYEQAGYGGDVGTINLWGSASGHAHRAHGTSQFPLPGMQLSSAVNLVNNSSQGIVITNPASGTEFLVRTNGEVEMDRVVARSFISLSPDGAAGWPAAPRFPGEVGWGASNGCLFVLYSTNGIGGVTNVWTRTNYFGP